jgi:hypothetical protein
MTSDSQAPPFSFAELAHITDERSLSFCVDIHVIVHDSSRVGRVNVPLDDATERWLRVEAAKRRITVATLIKRLLREEMRQQSAASSALRPYTSRPPVNM